MLAIHITHSAPIISRKRKFIIPDYELLSTILSALKWREHNGKIRLYTDKKGFDEYRKQNLCWRWDAGIDTDTLEGVESIINFDVFWAAGKIFALRNEACPCVIMDTDFIVWENISDYIDNRNDIICIHKEELMEGVYLPKKNLKTAVGYQFDDSWSWSAYPCNTAFVYFGNKALKDYYTFESIRFMENNLEKPKENVSQMVFAEQRLLAMCAEKLKIDIKVFMQLINFDNQNKFTHLWGYKHILSNNSTEQLNFCKKAVKRILKDFSNEFNSLYNVPVIKKYQ